MLKLPPQHNFVQIVEDHTRPGYVWLDFENVLRNLENKTKLKSVKLLQTLGKFVKNKYLESPLLNDWLKEVISKSLKELKYSVNGFQLVYEYRRTAHKIKATKGNKEINIDFVPVFKFVKRDWICSKPLPALKTKHWMAVPKQPVDNISNQTTANYTFIICCSTIERGILYDCNLLKDAIRLLKSLRDRYELKALNSYFIKTVFLLEIEKVPKYYWSSKVSDIFLEVINLYSKHYF